MLGDAHRIVRLADLEAQLRQRAKRRAALHAAAEMTEHLEGEAVLAGIVQQQPGAHVVGAQRRALGPVGQFGRGDAAIARGAQPRGRELAVEAGLVRRRRAVPGLGVLAVAQRLVGPAQPVAAAAEADRCLHRVVAAAEMGQGPVRAAQLAQRDPARQPFTIGIGITVRRPEVMLAGQQVALVRPAGAGRAPGQHRAPVRP